MTNTAIKPAANATSRKPVPQATVTGAASGGYLRHIVAIAKRSLIKMYRTPEALIDVTLQPIIFLLLFTYIFGGAIGGSSADYLQFLLPGLLAQSIAQAGVSLGQNLNADIEKGVFDRFRSLPIGRSVPLVGAVIADIGRYLILCVVTLGFGMIMGFRIETNALAATAGVGISIAFALVFLLDLGVRRDEGQDVRRGAGHHVPDRVAVVVRQQHLCQPGHHAELAADLRQDQSDLPTGHHHAWPDDRRTGRGKPDVDAGLDGDPADRVRATGPARLPQAHLILRTCQSGIAPEQQRARSVISTDRALVCADQTSTARINLAVM